MRIKNHFHLGNGLTLSLALKQRLGANRKWSRERTRHFLAPNAKFEGLNVQSRKVLTGRTVIRARKKYQNKTLQSYKLRQIMGEGLLLKLLLIFNKYKNILLINFICIYRHKRLPFLYSLCMSLYLANTSANQNTAIVSFSLKESIIII